MERLSIRHKQDTDTIFIFFCEGAISGTIEISAEQAAGIGNVARMALASKAAKEENSASQG